MAVSISNSDVSDLPNLLIGLPFLDQVNPAGHRVFLRADFNLPMDDNGSLVDDGRLRAALPTINYLLDRGARIIVGSHLRNPLESSVDGRPDPRLSLAPLARRLSRLWEVEVSFAPSAVGPETARAAADLAPGRVLLLENLRYQPGETANDPAFAHQLAELADIYVNDAFGVCHRDHASMTTLPALAPHSVAGFALKSELRALDRALANPARPLGAIIGGQNIEAKLPVLTKLMGLADFVFLGGTMGDAVARLAFGREVAHLGLSPEAVLEFVALLKNFRDLRAKLFWPIDMVAAPADDQGHTVRAVAAQNLSPELISEDIGPATRLWYWGALAQCHTIIWNGPMGAYETPAFARGTAMVTRAMAECQGVTLAGGADTSAAILKMSDRSQVSFLSAGGSAFLKALAGEPLVALEALLRAGADQASRP